jgi:hypothetical protein
MEVSKHLQSLLKDQEKKTNEILTLFDELLMVLRKEKSSAVLPVELYTKLYTTVFEITSNTTLLEKVAEKVSDSIATFMNDNVTKIFENHEEKTGEEMIDLLINSWEVANKLKEWIEKIFVIQKLFLKIEIFGRREKSNKSRYFIL